MQWRDATVNETDATGFEASGTLAARQEPDVRQVFDQVGMVAVAGSATALPSGLDLPCTEDPELFFAESPEDVETAKAMCRGCEARLACLTGALERREPWGVWGGELLMRGAIVPRKRPRGRPRKEKTAARSPPTTRWPDSTGHAAFKRPRGGQGAARPCAAHNAYTQRSGQQCVLRCWRASECAPISKKPNNCDLRAGCARSAGPAGSSPAPNAGW